MRYLVIIGCVLTTLWAGVAAAAAGRERVSLDRGWRFHLGDAADVARDFDFGRGMAFAKAGQAGGAVRPGFDDSTWQSVDVPHDWVVELDFDRQGDALHMYHGYKPVSRTKPATTIGWYRRAFDLPKSDLGRRLWLEFDGVFRDSIAWLNGHFLGRHMSGYSSFAYDITDCANYGGRNVLVLRVDASHYEGWFYEGAGIYRHVRLIKTNPLHVARWGTFVASVVKGSRATVTVRTKVANEGDSAAACQVISTVVGAEGKAVAAIQSGTMNIEPWAEAESVQQLKVANPRLWSVETPHMYRLVTTIKSGAGTVDTYETPFGIRTVRFDPNQGFFLNGKRVEIKGVCCHQDHAGVGSALPDRIQYYRIEKLKEMGCNAYRTSHNAPTPELLDACDRLGMLVMDEQRMMGSSEEILWQLARMVPRDRNHPSVILWSLGNEEDAIQGTDVGARIAATMKSTVKRLDPTRPVTVAMNGSWGRGFSNVVDVQGCNYMSSGDIDGYHKAHPNQPMIGTEEASTLCTRGIYANDPTRGYMSAYDAGAPPWGSTAEKFWQFYAARPFLAGGFVWTGFDYRGEPTPYAWPCISSHFGIMDTCGFPKDNYYYYQAWWSDRPVLHLLPHWNWPGKEGQEIAVWCHSNCDEVELLLNGRSLGRKQMPRNSHLEWKVPYAPGVLEARGFKAGRVIATEKVETTGLAAKVTLAPDRDRIRADGEDVSLVTVSITDAQGRVVPTADNDVSFEVSGGRIIGVGNGDPSSHEADKASHRKAFNGLCMVIVQSSTEAGPIRLTGTSPGIEPVSVVIEAVGVR